MLFRSRIADDLKKHLPESSVPVTDTSATIALIDPKLRSRIADAMSKGAGVLRSSNSLRVTLDRLQEISDLSSMVEPCVEAWETTNLHLIAIGLTRAALRRAETRGSHWREDFPETSPKWQRRIVERYSGEWSERLEEVL